MCIDSVKDGIHHCAYVTITLWRSGGRDLLSYQCDMGRLSSFTTQCTPSSSTPYPGILDY